MIKAIETTYKGYRFRSRLEARWAVFFDSMELEWEYEPEGFDLGKQGWYLPDFAVYSKDVNGDRFGIWIEVKGGEPNDEEIKKCEALADGHHFPVALVCGLPFENPCWLWAEDICDTGGGDWHGMAVIRWFRGEMSISCYDYRVDFDRTIYMSRGGFENPVRSYTGCITYNNMPARSARFEHGETSC